MRQLALILAAVLFFSNGALAQPADAEAVTLSTFSVDLRPRERDTNQVGRLRYLGGIVMRAEDRRFAGLSGLRFVDDGTRLLAVSDRGNWVTFRPTFDGERLTGARDAFLWPILNANGRPLRQPAFDAESLTLIGETAYVGFEHVHRVDAFAHPLGETNPTPERLRGNDAFGELHSNGSLEGLTALADARLLAIEEVADDDGTFDGWLMSADGTTESLALFAVAPYSLTDLVTLPGGDVVTLERRFSPIGGVGARLRLIPADRIAAGALLDGEELAELGAGFTVDNMEGLAVRERDGRTELFIISDDNQNPLQRTILMGFELLPE